MPLAGKLTEVVPQLLNRNIDRTRDMTVVKFGGSPDIHDDSSVLHELRIVDPGTNTKKLLQ